MMDVNCFVGTVYGGAEQLANNLTEIAHNNGVNLHVLTPGNSNDIKSSKFTLVITSTTGQGDIPVELEALFMTLQAEKPQLTGQVFGVIAMGDSSYGDTFCCAGKKFRQLLLSLNAIEIHPMLEIDAMEDFDPMPPATAWLDEFFTALNKAA